MDPQLTDPANGDFRPAPGSPAAEYGCQTFGPARGGTPPAARRPAPPAAELRQAVIDVSGSIDTDTLWNADLVRVVGDVTVEDGVILTIAPGVRVEFQDYYRLNVAGVLQAVGAAAHPIVFTTNTPEKFAVDHSHTGCWNGIHFDATRATNAPSRLSFCIIEYSKAVDERAGAPPAGGALVVTDFSKLTIANCLIRNNVAEFGGAVLLYKNANPVIASTVFTGNHAFQNASAIFCAYSYPQLVNNTIVENTIDNQGYEYNQTCALFNFVARPAFTNNIFRRNDPFFYYDHQQLRHNKEFYTHHNDIQDYTADDNIDADPLFVDTYHLGPGSPCIDAGAAVPGNPHQDFDGQARAWDGDGDQFAQIDIGADEFGSFAYGDLTCDGALDAADIDAFFVALGDPDLYALQFADCALSLADVNADGAADAGDIDVFFALLSDG